MFGRILVGCFALSSCAIGAQSPDCRTPIGVPCYTMRITQTQWQAMAYDPSKITKVTGTAILAVRSDGSSVNASDMKEESLFGRMLGERRDAQLYLAPEKTIVTINRTNRTIARREPLIWHDLPYRRSTDGDSTCKTGVRHFGTGL